MEILKIKNLNLKIREKEILKNVSLEIKEGEIIGLIGESGSGKTIFTKYILLPKIHILSNPRNLKFSFN